MIASRGPSDRKSQATIAAANAGRQGPWPWKYEVTTPQGRSRGLESSAVPHYTVGQAADLLGVSADTVRRLADRGELTMDRSPGGRRHLDGAALARYAQTRIARLGPTKTPLESARNHFPGLVTKVTKDQVMAQVEMVAGPFRVVSLMSREAADELALAPGSLVVAAVKSTAVVVEVPELRGDRG